MAISWAAGMERSAELESGHVSPPAVSEAGYSGVLPAAESEPFGVLISPSDQLGGFVLPDGTGTVLAPLPRPAASALKQPVVLDALSALVNVAVGHPEPAANPDDPLEPAGGPSGRSAESRPRPPAEQRCLVCDSRHSDRQRVSVFEESACTAASRRPVRLALEAALEAPLDPRAAHSHVLCWACFELAERLDQLQEELSQARAAVRRLYWQLAHRRSVRGAAPAPAPARVAARAAGAAAGAGAGRQTGRPPTAAGRHPAPAGALPKHGRGAAGLPKSPTRRRTTKS